MHDRKNKTEGRNKREYTLESVERRKFLTSWDRAIEIMRTALVVHSRLEGR